MEKRESYLQTIERLQCRAMIYILLRSRPEPTIFEEAIECVSPVTEGCVIKAVNGVTCNVLLVDENAKKSYSSQESKNMVLEHVSLLEGEYLVDIEKFRLEDHKRMMERIVKSVKDSSY